MTFDTRSKYLLSESTHTHTHTWESEGLLLIHEFLDLWDEAKTVLNEQREKSRIHERQDIFTQNLPVREQLCADLHTQQLITHSTPHTHTSVVPTPARVSLCSNGLPLCEEIWIREENSSVSFKLCWCWVTRNHSDCLILKISEIITEKQENQNLSPDY